MQGPAEGQNTVEVQSILMVQSSLLQRVQSTQQKVQSNHQQKVQSIHLLKEQNILCSGQSFSWISVYKRTLEHCSCPQVHCIQLQVHCI